MTPQRESIGGIGNLMFKQAYLYSQLYDGVIPDIYLQDEKYFNKYENEIRAIFGQGIQQLPYVSVHVRRGDYVGNSFYVDLTETDYYKKAIEYFPDRNFLIFSDDTNFCKEYFKDLISAERIIISGGKTDIEDMNLMASCKYGNIIANSSFSWWSAWLNPSLDKVVISPKEWHTDHIIRTVLPETWIKI